jgi:DNA repair protein RadA/Sms
MAKSKAKTVYTCQNCGAQRPRWEGRCTDCGAWNTLVEEVYSSSTSGESSAAGWRIEKSTVGAKMVAISLDQSPEELKLDRFETGLSEFNRVLGGGLARGSFVLLGGAPGIGKSTLLLQMAVGLANSNKKVLYVSGEESVAQTASRAHRLGLKNPKVDLASENNLSLILEYIKTQKVERPDVLIVDSIQTVFLPHLESAPGSVSQVRECAGHLMELAKQGGIAVLLIGHVTKDGSLAGPKVLEHMVDCVLSFDGDPSYQYRLLRSVKNRFGAANELGVFQMSSNGLEEVLNPSELFLQDRGENLMGSTVFSSMEGTRPLLCEIQALSSASTLAMPRRTTVGFDVNRVCLLTAVLDRYLDFRLATADLFVNVVGGLKIMEPAADLAVAAALISSESRQEIPAQACFFGEIGLTGEVRGVSFPELRVKEAVKLGFLQFFVPKANAKHLSSLNLKANQKIIYIESVEQLRKALTHERSKKPYVSERDI